MVTINNYSVSLSLEAGNYIKNSTLSRAETTRLRREIGMARTPAEKYELALTRLDRALKEGAINQATYNRLLETQRQKLQQATQMLRGHNSMVGQATASVKTWVAGYAGLATITKNLHGIRQVMVEIDATAKRGRAIGATADELGKLGFAAERLAGVDGPAVEEMLAKLVRRSGEFQLGLGEATKAFELLKMGIDDVRGLSAADLFNEVRRSIAAMKDPSLQAAAAVRFFESEGKKLIPLLSASDNEFAKLNQQYIEFHGLMGDTSGIENFNDNLANTQAIFRKTRMEAARALAVFGPFLGAANKVLASSGRSVAAASALTAYLGGDTAGAAAALGIELPRSRGAASVADTGFRPDEAARLKQEQETLRKLQALNGIEKLVPRLKESLGAQVGGAGIAATALGAGLQNLGVQIAGSFKFHTERLAKTLDTSLVPAFEMGSAETAQAILKAQNDQIHSDRKDDHERREREKKSLIVAEKSSGYLEEMLLLWKGGEGISRKIR